MPNLSGLTFKEAEKLRKKALTGKPAAVQEWVWYCVSRNLAKYDLTNKQKKKFLSALKKFVKFKVKIVGR